MAKRGELSRRPRISMVVEQAALSTFYKLGDTVGTGGFGKVKLATHTLTGETVAIKIMDKAALGDDFLRADLEISLLKELQHPKICRLYQVIDTPDKLYLVMEHCSNGELFDYLMGRERLTENDARIFFRQIISAVAFLHQKGCVHRDLKPENLLLDESQTIRLIDFGLAARPKGGMDSLLETCCGSPAYVAPELITGDPYMGAQADMWSLGILLYVFVAGSLPFNDDDVNKLFRKIQRGVYDMPKNLSPDLKNLIRDLLQLDPTRRIKMSSLIGHRWVMGPYGVPVKVCFAEDPEIDLRILDAMSPAAPMRRNEMIDSVRNKKYDYFHATYLILKHRAKVGKVARIDPAGLPVHNANQFRQPAFRSPVPPSIPPYESVKLCDISFDRDEDENVDSDSDTSMSLASSANPSTESVSENVQPLRDPNGTLHSSPWKTGKRETYSPPRRKESSPPRLTPSKSWGTDLDRDENIPMNSNQRDIRKSKSMEDGLENSGLLTPKKSAKRPTQENSNRLTVRKVFGSIERSLGRVKEVLTPGKFSTPSGRHLRELKGNSITNNVTMVNSTDANAVLDGIKEALKESGYEWKVKRGYVIRAKKMGAQGQLLLKLSLEVCWISNQTGTCGIRRKRLEGDAYQYKKLYAALHGKILNMANAENGSRVLSVPPTRLAFDC